MHRIEDNSNYIANPKGRKWVWGNIKVIGQFSAIDFLIIFFALLITIPLWFISAVDKLSLFFVSIILYLGVFISIIEVHGQKNYEMVWEWIKFCFQKDNHFNSKQQFIENIEVYEVLKGFDVTNLTATDKSLIEGELRQLFSMLRSGSIKIKKFNSTLRIKNYTDQLEAMMKDLDVDQDENKGKLLLSYYANVDLFKKQSMPNLFIEFHGVNENEMKGLLKRFVSVLNLKKIETEEYNALHQSIFGTDDYKVLKHSIKSEHNEISACRIEWGRNVPSFYLQDLIFNNSVSFAIEIKNPSFEEKEIIKKDVKKWSKKVIKEQELKGKNLIEQQKEIDEMEAQDNIYSDFLFDGNDIKLFNGWVIFEKDKTNPLDMKKQIADLNLVLKTTANINLIAGMNEQLQNLENFTYKAKDVKRWFPVNSSTIAYGCPFQNKTTLDQKGAYIGKSEEIFPFVLDSWKDGAASKHTGIIARTGAGKSILMQILLASDEAMHKVKNIVLDPKDSGFGRTILNRFGGEEIDVWNYKINPFSFGVELNQTNIDEMIENKAAQIEEFLFLLFSREAKHSENASLLSEFANLIKKFLIKKKNYLLNGAEFSFEEIKVGINTQRFDFFFEKLIYGTFSRFNCKDDFIFKSNRSTVFNLKKVIDSPNDAIKNAILFLILNKVNNEIYERDDKETKLGVWIDEAGDFFKSDYLVSIVEKMVVKSRAFKTKIVWATQNITDLIGTDNSKLASILANSEHLFTGQLKDNQLAELNKMLLLAESESFSEVEKDWIKESISVEDKGKFIYQSGGTKTLIQVDYLGNFIIKDWIENELERKGRE